MKSPDTEATLAAHTGASTVYAEEETSPQRTEAAYEVKKVAEKPHVSKEIVIEEINIDGMCGVY